MKIAIDISQIVYQGTGVARYTEELTKHILNLDTTNSYILYAGSLRTNNIIQRYKSTSPWSNATWKTSHLSPRISSILFNKLNIPIDYFVGSVDILHTSDWTQPRTKSKTITITTVHDLVFKKYPETLDPLILNTQRIRMKRVVKYANHIIADSMSTKHDLVQTYGIQQDRISVIYLGYDDRFSKQPIKEIERVKNKYKIYSQYILSLGTKEPRKNIQRTIEAFKIYKQKSKNKNLILVIAGKHGWGDSIKIRR